MSIGDFLLARITEDEERRTAYWHDSDCGTVADALDDCTCGAQTRVLAECEAKRRIVALCDDYEEPAPSVLLALALPYADHPDYDESWRP